MYEEDRDDYVVQKLSVRRLLKVVCLAVGLLLLAGAVGGLEMLDMDWHSFFKVLLVGFGLVGTGIII